MAMLILTLACNDDADANADVGDESWYNGISSTFNSMHKPTLSIRQSKCKYIVKAFSFYFAYCLFRIPFRWPIICAIQ